VLKKRDGGKKEMFDGQLGIIPSLDVDIKEALMIIDNIKDLKQEVAGLKIGSILAWKYGLTKVVKDIKEICDFPIMFDAQKAGTDIPDIVKEQVNLVADANIDAFIASPLGAGSATLEAFIKACFERDVSPIVVIEMTHPYFDAFLSENASEKVLKQSLDLGVENFVAPANKPAQLKLYKNIAREMNRSIKIFSPGVVPQGGGPDSAVEAGTNFVIVGRSIYQAENPSGEVTRVYKLMMDAFRKTSK
jgi:orotidine-5'-phosphate decarboxylase